MIDAHPTFLLKLAGRENRDILLFETRGLGDPLVTALSIRPDNTFIKMCFWLPTFRLPKPETLCDVTMILRIEAFRRPPCAERPYGNRRPDIHGCPVNGRKEIVIFPNSPIEKC